MKKIVLFLVLFLFSLDIISAYNPTEIEEKTLSRLKVLFEKQVEKKMRALVKKTDKYFWVFKKKYIRWEKIIFSFSYFKWFKWYSY